MTDKQAVEQLRAVRIFCDPVQVQAVDRAIAALRERKVGAGLDPSGEK